MNVSSLDAGNAGVRLHALDAVRAAALLLGIVLHASLSFFPPGPVNIWPVVDHTSSHTLGLASFVIHTFRMLLFFILAGFFARMLVNRDGLRAFLRGRARRVLVPFVATFAVVVPLTAAIPLLAPHDGFDAGRLPRLVHLWFLYLLLWFYVLIALGAPANGVVPVTLQRLWDTAGDRLAGSAWLPLVAAIPGAIALSTLPAWVAWFGIPPADWLPNRAAFVCYGSGVYAGWLLHRRIDTLHALAHRWRVNLLLALTATTACVTVVGIRPNYGLAGDGVATLAYAWLYCVAGWSWSFSIIGIGMRLFSAPNRVIRFVADASYWVYLIHLPLVILVQAIVATWSFHWAVKFLIVASAPTPVLFGSYYLLCAAAELRREPLRSL